jgi:hypothetical protein
MKGPGANDITTPGKRLIFHIFSALRQFERVLIPEQNHARFDAEAARGSYGRRKSVVRQEKRRRAQSPLVRGFTVRGVTVRIIPGRTHYAPRSLKPPWATSMGRGCPAAASPPMPCGFSSTRSPIISAISLQALTTPEPIKDWTLTTLEEKLIKIGAKVVRST